MSIKNKHNLHKIYKTYSATGNYKTMRKMTMALKSHIIFLFNISLFNRIAISNKFGDATL